MRLASDIAGAGVGPGPALVVADAGGLAGLVALAFLEFETAVVAAGPIDRAFDRVVARFHHAGAAHARHAAIIRNACRHGILQPAHRAARDIGRVAEGPGMAAPVALARERAIRRIAGGDRRVLVIASGAIEIGL